MNVTFQDKKSVSPVNRGKAATSRNTSTKFLQNEIFKNFCVWWIGARKPRAPCALISASTLRALSTALSR